LRFIRRDWCSFQGKCVSRALASHFNSIEAFGFFSVGVVLATLAQADSTELAKLCNAFLVVRAVYIPVYIVAVNTPLSVVRSAIWTVGVLVLLRIYAMAAV
jgi:uncharacterized MAPEG superfamily protein